MGHEFKHLSPSSAEVKNEWSYTPAVPIRLRGMDRNNFGFALNVNTLKRESNSLSRK